MPSQGNDIRLSRMLLDMLKTSFRGASFNGFKVDDVIAALERVIDTKGETEMSADKRTVSTDALETLGTILEQKEASRDAIHLAVIAATAGCILGPGEHVRLTSAGLAVPAYGSDDRVGIVDPFLPESVCLGERFWLVIYPRVITSLRHVWTHPSIPDEVPQVSPADKEESRVWLEAYAQRLLGYESNEANDDDVSPLDVLLSGAEDGSFGMGLEGPEREPTGEFWMHFERYTGRKVANRPDWFRCSC